MRLATAAERLGLLDAAETVYRRVAADPPADPNQFVLVGFLARHARLKDAVDLCESLWANADADLREKVAAACVGILSDPATPADPVQLQRVIGWVERARLEKPQSMMYLLGLGNLNERLGDYRKAEEMYRTAINSQRPRRHRLQQPRLADRAAQARGGQRGPRPDQQAPSGPRGKSRSISTPAA